MTSRRTILVVRAEHSDQFPVVSQVNQDLLCRLKLRQRLHELLARRRDALSTSSMSAPDVVNWRLPSGSIDVAVPSQSDFDAERILGGLEAS